MLWRGLLNVSQLTMLLPTRQQQHTPLCFRSPVFQNCWHFPVRTPYVNWYTHIQIEYFMKEWFITIEKFQFICIHLVIEINLLLLAFGMFYLIEWKEIVLPQQDAINKSLTCTNNFKRINIGSKKTNLWQS